MPLSFGTAVACVLAGAAAVAFVRNSVVKAAGLGIASAVAFDLVLGFGVVPQLHDLWLSPRAAQLAAANRQPGDAPIVLTGYVEPSLVFLLGPETRLEPARRAAAETGHGGLALVESRATAEFLIGAASLGLAAEPLGNVRGLDYSIGRKEQITLYRVMPPAR